MTSAPTWMALMYHEIELPERTLCDPTPGYRRYVVSLSEFEAQVGLLRQEGLRGVSISEALDPPSVSAEVIALTFDDGCETDLLAAAPRLRAAGFGATFFLVSGFLGRPGYLPHQSVRALREQGFEIGSHGMTHRFLTSLSQAELEGELRDSKRTLEDLGGGEVRHLSCPGGRWNQRVAETAKTLGFASVATSRIGPNRGTEQRLRLARLAVKRGVAPEVFRRRCRGENLGTERWRAALLGTARRTIGDALYDSIQRRFG